MSGIKDAIKVILAVLGLVSAYPDVEWDNLLFRLDFNKDFVYAQFKASNLINPAIQDVINSGIEVNLVYQIRTSAKNKLVYDGTSIRRIAFTGKGYSVNGRGSYSFDLLTNIISVNEMVILTNASQYTNHIDLKTQIELLISCDSTPEIMKLWGKHPKISIPFNIGE